MLSCIWNLQIELHKYFEQVIALIPLALTAGNGSLAHHDLTIPQLQDLGHQDYASTRTLVACEGHL